MPLRARVRHEPERNEAMSVRFSRHHSRSAPPAAAAHIQRDIAESHTVSRAFVNTLSIATRGNEQDSKWDVAVGYYTAVKRFQPTLDTAQDGRRHPEARTPVRFARTSGVAPDSRVLEEAHEWERGGKTCAPGAHLTDYRCCDDLRPTQRAHQSPQPAPHQRVIRGRICRIYEIC